MAVRRRLSVLLRVTMAIATALAVLLFVVLLLCYVPQSASHRRRRLLRRRRPPALPVAAAETRITSHCSRHLPTDARTDLEHPFNERDVCLLSDVCVRPRRRRGGPSRGQQDVMVTFAQRNRHSLQCPERKSKANSNHYNCSRILEDVLCAHGSYWNASETPTCPRVQLRSDDFFEEQKEEEEEEEEGVMKVIVIVPVYKHLVNIFHYMQMVGSLLDAISIYLPSRLQADGLSHKSLNLSIVLRSAMPSQHGSWQHSAISLLSVFSHLHPRIISITIHSTYEDAFFSVNVTDRPRIPKPSSSSSSPPSDVCGRVVLFLGQRFSLDTWPFVNGHSRNLWPFANSTPGALSVTRDNNSVSITSLQFRQLAYIHANLSSNLLQLPLPLSPSPPDKSLLLDLPPPVLLYASRNRFRDPVPGRFVQGTVRRFSDLDEQWFTSMLRSQALFHNLSFKHILHDADTPFRTQVATFRNAGVIVGIHGANLLNSLFAPPFASLLEISNHPSRCYVAGGNAGLAFMSYKPTLVPSVNGSACPGVEQIQGAFCRLNGNWRRVDVKSQFDRIMVTRLVDNGITWLLSVRKAFAHLNAVPVLWRANESEFRIDWSKASFPYHHHH